jgi:hypothetical protein
MPPNPERDRLTDHQAGKGNWKRWGPCLSERAWGTVREDYSANGDAWPGWGCIWPCSTAPRRS